MISASEDDAARLAHALAIMDRATVDSLVIGRQWVDSGAVRDSNTDSEVKEHMRAMWASARVEAETLAGELMRVDREAKVGGESGAIR